MGFPDESELQWNGNQGEARAGEAQLTSEGKGKETPLGTISQGDVMPGTYSTHIAYPWL